MERGQLKRNKEGRTGGDLNLNSTVINDRNKKSCLNYLFSFAFNIHRKTQGKKTLTEINTSYQSNNSKTLKHLHFPKLKSTECCV